MDAVFRGDYNFKRSNFFIFKRRRSLNLFDKVPGNIDNQQFSDKFPKQSKTQINFSNKQ